MALTPLVFVMFEDHYQEFAKRFETLSFKTLHDAFAMGTWAEIAGKPEWGPFTFAISNPARHNSGLASLTLILSEFWNKDDSLAVGDVEATVPHLEIADAELEPGELLARQPVRVASCQVASALEQPSCDVGASFDLVPARQSRQHRQLVGRLTENW